MLINTQGGRPVIAGPAPLLESRIQGAALVEHEDVRGGAPQS
jgi:hypothetical protein